MRPSSVFPDKSHSARKDRHCFLNIGALPPFLFLSLLLSTILSLFILYSPNPLRLSPSSKPHHSLQKDERDDCDLYDGRWVPDLRGSLYTNSSCRTIPETKNCFLQGRQDRDFLNWRWKPKKCELPRFDPRAFLEMVRGKTMAFIGDSVARNQMESLLCLLSQEETPVDVYKDSEDRFRTWRFAGHGFTLKVLWSKFLVAREEISINDTLSGSFKLHIDKVDESWASELPGVDYAIVSSAHWFFRKIYVYDGPDLVGCVYCSEPNVTSFSPEHALGLAMRSAFNHIKTCESCKVGLVTLLRTFSPAHFENGAWNTGGACNRTGPYSEGEINMESSELHFRNVQVAELGRVMRAAGDRARPRFGVLDVTRAMLMRPDGHPGEFWGNKWMKGYSDCVHWCLPGPIDVWNEFLMSSLRKFEDNGD